MSRKWRRKRRDFSWEKKEEVGEEGQEEDEKDRD